MVAHLHQHPSCSFLEWSRVRTWYEGDAVLCQEKPKIRDHLVSGFFAVNPPLTRKANELSSLIYDLVFSMGNN